MSATYPRKVDFFLKRNLSLLAIIVAFLVLGSVGSSFVDFSFIEAVRDFPGGLSWLLANFMPTLSSFQYTEKIALALASTVLNAVSAVTLASLAAYVCAVVASRITGFGGLVQLFVRGVATVIRNIPVVAWAFILLISFKQSEFTGYLALFLKSYGFLTRCFLETVDEVSVGSIEALRATGASRLQIIIHAVIPQSITQVISWTLFRLESNIRDATLVGILTGTGIGFVFELYYRSFRYDAAGLVVIGVALTVFVLEACSNLIRHKVIEGDKTPHLSAGIRMSKRGNIKTRVMVRSNVLLAATIFVLGGMTVYALIQMNYGRVDLGQATLNALRSFSTLAFEPCLDGHFEFIELVEGLFITLSLALLTMLGGTILGFVLGVFAATNLTGRLISNTIKLVSSVVRAVPTILWVLIFTVAIGLGSEACIVGMMFHTVAFLTKAFSEAFEEVDPGVLDALRSTGATWWQVIFCGVLPEKLNELLSWIFIRFESNFVNSVVVGAIAGAGGIGYQLYLTANFYFNMHEVGLIIYMCLAVSITFEILATQLRKRLAVK